MHGKGNREGRARGAVWLCAVVLASFWCMCGCARKPDPEGLRVVVSLPQWFYPSAERPWAERVWQEIARAHPETALTLELSPGRTEQVLQKLLVVRASGDRGPDLACIRMQWAGELGRRGALVPLVGVVPDSVWHGMVSSLLPAAGRDGVFVLIPYDVGVRVILYREDLFREAGMSEPRPGWTREDLVRAARALTRSGGGDGGSPRWGFGLPGARHEKTIFQWLPWFWSLGGELAEGADGAPPSLESEASVRAVQWYRDLVWEHRVTPATCYAMDQAAVFQGLAGGVFAMTEGGSWEPALLDQYSRRSHQVKIAPLPSMEPGLPPVTLVDGWGFVMLTRDPEKQKVIGQALSALASPAHQLEKYEAGGMLSPYEALYRDGRFLADPAAGVLADAVRRGKPVPDFATFPMVQEALEISLQEVLMNNADPASVLGAQQAALERRGRSDRERQAPPPEAAVRPAPSTGGPEDGERAERGLPPPGSLLLSTAGEPEERLLSRGELLSMPRRLVGDLELVPLTAFFPGEAPGDVVARAADGYEKRVPAERIQDAFLDPESLYLYLVGEPGGRIFTVRDVTRITREARMEPGGLAVVAGDVRHEVSASRLGQMAREGVVSFGTLIEKALEELPDGRTVRLTARDGYSRDVPARDFRGGRLHLEGMKCEFPGRPSKDQVSGLARIDVR